MILPPSLPVTEGQRLAAAIVVVVMIKVVVVVVAVAVVVFVVVTVVLWFPRLATSFKLGFACFHVKRKNHF